ELEAAGVPGDEAERRALEEFGDVKRARRVLRAESGRTERAVRRSEWWAELVQDVRYGWRKLVGQPVFAA
ncbi:MAG: hypothetical protein GWM90_15795, partial [Gemmatimonadetes bacterium]|nr:hypothetical protein [Gemmatimonadota bacterium]NIQ56832.1 hypothetical protein [Gemmatimonadota bacterium]NIU77015.1 hypothetical protein [Gammaproteobacteria bacterium]NIX45511.1 hypothetical protein [Gemmatimonadota bacterium]NIY09797.1 hypothetical protein [Gemmatimonadota bacterium]